MPSRTEAISKGGQDAHGQSSVVAAIPYRLDAAGAPRVLLVTNSRGEWIVPKGGVDGQMSPQGAALQEAWEEAGAHGYIVGGQLGWWRTTRRGRACQAAVFVMVVEELAAVWPEDHRRQRRWCTLREAGELVTQPDLRALIALLAKGSRGTVQAA